MINVKPCSTRLTHLYSISARLANNTVPVADNTMVAIMNIIHRVIDASLWYCLEISHNPKSKILLNFEILKWKLNLCLDLAFAFRRTTWIKTLVSSHVKGRAGTKKLLGFSCLHLLSVCRTEARHTSDMSKWRCKTVKKSCCSMLRFCLLKSSLSCTSSSKLLRKKLATFGARKSLVPWHQHQIWTFLCSTFVYKGNLDSKLQHRAWSQPEMPALTYVYREHEGAHTLSALAV